MSVETHEATVTVISGIYLQRLPLAGKTVAAVRALVHPLMDVPPDARAVLDGRLVGEDALLCAGQVLHFVRPAAEIG